MKKFNILLLAFLMFWQVSYGKEQDGKEKDSSLDKITGVIEFNNGRVVNFINMEGNKVESNTNGVEKYPSVIGKYKNEYLYINLQKSKILSISTDGNNLKLSKINDNEFMIENATFGFRENMNDVNSLSFLKRKTKRSKNKESFYRDNVTSDWLGLSVTYSHEITGENIHMTINTNNIKKSDSNSISDLFGENVNLGDINKITFNW